MSERANGISTALLTYFQENADKVVTVDMLLKAFPAYDRNQIHGNVYNLRKKPHGQAVEQLQRGMWRYVGPTEAVKPAETPGVTPPQKDHMQFEILKTSEDGKHMIGLADGDIYKISHLA